MHSLVCLSLGGENTHIVKLENSTERSFDIIALESESTSIDDRIKIESSASEDNKLSFHDQVVQKCTSQKHNIEKQKEEISCLKNMLAEKEKVCLRVESVERENSDLKRKLAEYEERERKEKEDQEKVLNSIMSDDSE